MDGGLRPLNCSDSCLLKFLKSFVKKVNPEGTSPLCSVDTVAWCEGMEAYGGLQGTNCITVQLKQRGKVTAAALNIYGG